MRQPKVTQNHFTLNNGVIVGNAYARKRILARLRVYGIPLEDRQAIADHIISCGWYRGLVVEALGRLAVDIYYSGRYNEETKEVESS